MADFKFSLEDLTGDDPEAAIGREMGKFFVNGKPFKTSISAFGGSKSFNTLSLGEVMMGVPVFNDKRDVAAFNERTLSTLLTGSLMHLDNSDDQPGVGSINPVIDFLIPSDVRAQAEITAKNLAEAEKDPASKGKIGSRVGNPNNPLKWSMEELIKGTLKDQKSYQTSNGGSTGSGGAGTGTGTGWQNGDPSGQVLYTVPDFPVGADGRVDTTMLLQMPNFQKAHFSGNNTDEEIKSGFLRPEVYKMLSYLCQQIVPSFSSAYRTQKENDDLYGRVGVYSNHVGRGAVDIDAFAWPNSPDNFVRVEDGAACNPYLDVVYKILNSITGLDRPDEVIGPTYHPLSSEDSRMWTRTDHGNHVHIGFQYGSLGNPDGPRANLDPDSVLEALPSMPIVAPPPPPAPSDSDISGRAPGSADGSPYSQDEWVVFGPDGKPWPKFKDRDKRYASPPALYLAIRAAGLEPFWAVILTAISGRETGGSYDTQIENNDPTTGDFRSMGLFQINSGVHLPNLINMFGNDWEGPLKTFDGSVRYAVWLIHRNGVRDWGPYKPGADPALFNTQGEGGRPHWLNLARYCSGIDVPGGVPFEEVAWATQRGRAWP